MNKLKVISKYANKNLGKAAYKNGPTYEVAKLSDINEAYSIMWEIWTHEGYLTKEGLSFLDEYYGLKNLAEYFSKKGGFDEAKDAVSVLDWLKGLKLETVDM
jgi:hypothetical protein